jgi:hypothetical protein
MLPKNLEPFRQIRTNQVQKLQSHGKRPHASFFIRITPTEISCGHVNYTGLQIWYSGKNPQGAKRQG